MTRAASTAPPSASASPARRSSPSSISPRWNAVTARRDVSSTGRCTSAGWQPGQLRRQVRRRYLAARALARSSNSVAVQLTHEVGPGAGRTRRRAGWASFGAAGGALAGAGHLRGHAARTHRRLCAPSPMAARASMPYAIVRIRTASGKVLYQRSRGSGMGRVIGASTKPPR